MQVQLTIFLEGERLKHACITDLCNLWMFKVPVHVTVLVLSVSAVEKNCSFPCRNSF